MRCLPCACSVFSTLLAWHLWVSFFVILRFVFPPYPPYNFLSTELSGSSVMGAWGGLGAGGSWLGCGLGRPVRCSSALGLWLGLQPPGFLGTYPSIATWALIYIWSIFSVQVGGFFSSWWSHPYCSYKYCYTDGKFCCAASKSSCFKNCPLSRLLINNVNVKEVLCSHLTKLFSKLPCKFCHCFMWYDWLRKFTIVFEQNNHNPESQCAICITLFHWCYSQLLSRNFFFMCIIAYAILLFRFWQTCFEIDKTLRHTFRNF